jgi:hypothetical protein
MTHEANKIESVIETSLYEHFFNHLGPFEYMDIGTFELPDDDELRALGEDPDDENGSSVLILRRESDGRYFEIGINVTAWETTAAERREDRERRARAAARSGSRPASAVPPGSA